MSDFARLEEKLAKLRQRERGAGEGRIIRGDAARLLAAVLTEVDETILPRQVCFLGDDGTILNLAVANRRLQAMMAPAPDVPGADALIGAPLTDADGDGAMALRDAILATMSKTESWTLSSARPGAGGGFASDAGIPAAILMRAWGAVAHASISAEDKLKAFVGNVGDRAGAWILIEGEDVTGSHGPDEAIAALANHAAIVLDGYFSGRDAMLQGETGPAAMMFAGARGSRGLAFIDAGAAMAFLVVKDSRGAELLAEWAAEIAL